MRMETFPQTLHQWRAIFERLAMQHFPDVAMNRSTWYRYVRAYKSPGLWQYPVDSRTPFGRSHIIIDDTLPDSTLRVGGPDE